MYFLFNADLSKFDSQYYDISYIHSLLLNSGPWTEIGTVKMSTLNIQQNKASEQKHLILSQHQSDLLLHLPVLHLPVHHLPHHNNTSSISEMKENRIMSEIFQHSRACGLTFRIKMASPQKLLNISQCLSYSEASR